MDDILDGVLRRWIKREGKKLLKRENVVGFSEVLQPRIKNGRIIPTTNVVRIYVSTKITDEEGIRRLEASGNLIPKSLLTPTKDSEIGVDVVEIGVIKALSSDPKKRYRPLVAGISAMHKDGTACTLGLKFKDNESGVILEAQNNHCCALENKAKIGDEILQPSPYDGGSLENDVVGHLFKFVPISINNFNCQWRESAHKIFWGLRGIFGKKRVAQENKVDIGFFKPIVDSYQEVLDKGEVVGKTEVYVGDGVWKVGRTTGYTDNGIVIDTDWNGSVQYSRGTVLFTDCILVQGNKFSQGGDSTSFTQKGDKTIGSLFAGSDSHSIICKIDNIETEGEVTLI